MDGNKDEALRCIKIAESSLESGDKQRALKFVKIAKQLYPTISADYILSAIENPDTSKPIPQRENHHVSKGTHQPETSINYTEEQVRLVREIRKNKDYYAILGVEKTSSAEEIKRAYKKLALKIHPDKNRAPGAEEAFKSVLEAFNCLSNKQSRKNDDHTEQPKRNDDRTEQPSNRGGMMLGLSNRGGMMVGLSNRGGMMVGLSNRGGMMVGLSNRGMMIGLSNRGGMMIGLSNRGGMMIGLSNRGGMMIGLSNRGGMMIRLRNRVGMMIRLSNRGGMIIRLEVKITVILFKM